MREHRFDAVLAALAKARSRREMVAALLATFGGVAALDDVARAGQVAAEACRGRKAKCKRKNECCSERCRSRKGRKRKCACSAEGKRCLATDDCCEDGVRLFCVSSFCVRDRG